MIHNDFLHGTYGQDRSEFATAAATSLGTPTPVPLPLAQIQQRDEAELRRIRARKYALDPDGVLRACGPALVWREYYGGVGTDAEFMRLANSYFVMVSGNPATDTP